MVIAPWSIRNTRLQGVFTVVDTMGGINLRCGNYEYTPHYRMWDAISLTGEENWSYELRREHSDVSTWTEGQKDQWAQRKAVAFIRANPLLTLQRSLIRFADFWGPERVFLGGLRQRLYAPPVWFAVLAGAAILVSHLVVMLLAFLGVFLAAPRDGRAHAFLLLIVLFVCGIHTLVFGHPRYQLPLVPILILYAASATSTRCWRRLREGFSTAAAPLAALAILLIVWVRQAWIELPVDLPRLIAASVDASRR